MDHPVKVTVELTKEEKIRQLNERLNNMLKTKKVDPTKVVQQAIDVAKQEQKKQAKVAANKLIEDNKSIVEKGEGEETNQMPQKSKIIKKVQKKDVKTMRKSAGQVWQDKTMEDWPQKDYRIFCGNLGNEVNDQILASVFRRYSSFQMARVVRDRRTGKTRGYGFISFLNPNDFLNALKQMNGKHVGNRPVKLMKSSWKDRDLNSAKNQFLPSDFKKNSQKETHKICVDFKYVSPL